MSNGNGDDPNQVQVAAQLGISVSALWRLSANPAFPQPTSSNDGLGDLTWSTASINSFVALWNAALANG